MHKYLLNIFLQTFRQAEQESADYMARRGRRLDGKLVLIATLCAINLSLIHYFQDTTYLFDTLRQAGASSLADSWSLALSQSPHAQLIRLGWWASLIIFFYLIIPSLVIRLVLKEKLSDYGVRFQGAFKDSKLYMAMLLVMIPLVLYFSGTTSFQNRYPFYELKAHEHLFPDFMIWELLYFLQFVSLEFFFRGFLLHGLKQRFGFYSILVMLIPYCMIHFGKPLPETLAAILAGIILGILSLKSRSILLGIAIHYSVALTMDLCALWQKGFWNHP